MLKQRPATNQTKPLEIFFWTLGRMSPLLQPRWYCGSVCVGSIRLERKTSHTTHGGHVDVKTIILSLFVRTASSSFGFQPLITPLSYCHNNDIPNEADSCKYSSALLHVYDICDRVIAMLLCHLSAPLQKKKRFATASVAAAVLWFLS